MATRWAAPDKKKADLRCCPRCLREYELAQRFCPFDGEALSRLPLEELTRGRPSSRTSGLFAERYAVRGFLGKGAMTQVLLGEDVFTREPVAIKVLDLAFRQRAEVIARFTRESEALGRIRHGHVVRALAAGVDDEGLPFQVLEHLQGESLDALLLREPRLQPRLVVRMLLQLTSALEAVHTRDILHRDIKPANLMVTGGDGVVFSLKLVDFGFAHVHGSSIVTPPGTALGTVAYMSPEQVVGDALDRRTDIYSLGVLAYRLLCGSLPFEGEGVVMMARQLAETVPPVRSRAQVDEGLEAVVARATRKRPDLRYASARSMREDLERVEAGKATEAAAALGRDDPYRPGPGLPTQAARFLYGKLGLVAPPWEG